MDQILEIVKYVVPALVVVLSSWLILRNQSKAEEQKQKEAIALETHKFMLPLRLQAYERLSLLLERISPESLLMRHSGSNMLSHQLHTELLSSIRAEYEHNMSQQIYVTPKVWDAVLLARTQTIQIINLSATAVDATASSFDLSKKIIEHCATHSKLPTVVALETLRTEVGTEFKS